MKNLNKVFYLFLILSFPLFQSCDRNDDSAPVGEFSRGVIISDEGNFTRSNASVTHFKKNTNEIRYRIFEGVNNRPLGDVLQSMHFDNGSGYLVLNGSNKVEVVEEHTFKSKGVIEDELNNPRYFTTSGNKGYVSNWGAFNSSWQLEESYIAVVDLSNNKTTKKIVTDLGTEFIGTFKNKIFASNNYSNTISIINASSDEVEATIELATRPGKMVEDASGNIWIICSGDYDENNGKLFVIDPSTNEILKGVELGINTSGSLSLNKEKNKVYYTSGKSVYVVDIAAEAAPATPLFSNEELLGSISALGIDPENNTIYIGDARAFQGSGKVLRYSITGEYQDEFSSGIGPNSFWFK